MKPQPLRQGITPNPNSLVSVVPPELDENGVAIAPPSREPRRDLAVDPFHPLLRMVDRYRHDVHHLEGAATAEILRSAEAALGQPLPPSLVAFLERWNGATLFRGALRLRAAHHLAPAAEHVPQVIVFADGPGEWDRWAFGPGPSEGLVFGRWIPSDAPGQPCGPRGAFEPQHARFDRWMAGTLRILDENLRDPDAALQARLALDPESGHLLFQAAERALTAGDPDKALPLLRRATEAEPALIEAWMRLGDALVGVDDAAAREALGRALRGLRCPAPIPLRSLPDAELVRSLVRMSPPGDPALERDLRAFLDEGVTDVTDAREAELVELASVELARVLLRRGDRHGAREGLAAALDRARAVSFKKLPSAVVLLIARLEVELGQHDDAERHLRLLREAPGREAARALLELGRLAVMRQEPWAEEILSECIEGLSPSPRDPADPHLRERAEALLLLAERHRVHDRVDRATECLELARPLCEKARSDKLFGLLALGLGDVAIQKGDHAGAEAAYRVAMEKASSDAELRERVLVRRGDLFALTGDSGRAAHDYQRAAEGFAAQGLPVREAWARLRLARLGHPAAAEQARQLFKAADLAAGVAAADAVLGDPGASVEWHLIRTTDHARDRANAQRARPPLARADADRPERRIGAHRMSIAACDVGVVHTLGAWMDVAAKALDTAAQRITDPNLTRYIAAVDLLAAHRSYEAAEILLRHLLEVRPSGPAGRALVGAIARSGNAPLVSALLDALSSGMDASGLAAAAEVLGWRREEAAVPALQALLQGRQPQRVRKAAITALGRIGDPNSVEVLLDIIDEAELAEELSTALLLLGEWKGVDMQAQFLAERRPSNGRSLGEIVGRYGGPAYLLLLYRTAELEGPAGFGALQGLGYLGDPRAVPRLLDALGGRDPNRVRVASASLEMITGHTENPEESLLRNRWIEHWEKHGGRYRDGLRYRMGKLLDPGGLIERLHHDDATVRRSTYDELVISTGARNPFDAEGPYRVQRAHLAAWGRWWREHRDRFAAGRWTFHGDPIG